MSDAQKVSMMQIHQRSRAPSKGLATGPAGLVPSRVGHLHQGLEKASS
jgi:hypothetical protein